MSEEKKRAWLGLTTIEYIYIYKKHIIIEDSSIAFRFIPPGLDYLREILLKLILPRLKLNMAEISINVPFSLYRGIIFLSFKKSKETWICNLWKTPFSKRASEVVGRCNWNTITSHCAVLIRKSQSW